MIQPEASSPTDGKKYTNMCERAPAIPTMTRTCRECRIAYDLAPPSESLLGASKLRANTRDRRDRWEGASLGSFH
jgi:hypothetical protein